MLNRSLFAAVVLFGALIVSKPAQAAPCTPTGFFRDGINMTAALINPPGTLSATVDATGCNIVVYYGAGANGTVKNADLFGANYFGVLVNGDAGEVSVDVLSNHIHDIGETPHNGAQHGVCVYYRGFFAVSAVTGKITGNQLSGCQKGDVVANGQGTQVTVMDNDMTGDGHVHFIAQNGIQVGFGASGLVMHNTVDGHSFDGSGDGSASGGVIVVGGPGYGICPDGNPCPFSTNVKVNNNTLSNNDVGVFFSNLEADGSAPTVATNNKAVNNLISNDQCFNISYQTGVSDVGNNDKMIANTITGPGYVGCATLFNPSGNLVDADPSFTNRPKVHATK